MAETKIIIVKPQTIGAKDKEKLARHGHLVIEHPAPDTVRILQNESFDGGIVLQAALETIRDWDISKDPRTGFGSRLSKALTVNK